jgi:hypothetical protein
MTSITPRYDVACSIIYVYGKESLQRIENDGKQFIFSIDQTETDDLARAIDSEEGLALSSVKAFLLATSFVGAALRDMRRGKNDSWSAPRSAEWWSKSRENLKARQGAKNA